MQKRVLIIMGCGNTDFCRFLFKKLKILPLMSQLVLSLLTIVVKNWDHLFDKFRNSRYKY